MSSYGRYSHGLGGGGGSGGIKKQLMNCVMSAAADLIFNSLCGFFPNFLYLGLQNVKSCQQIVAMCLKRLALSHGLLQDLLGKPLQDQCCPTI